jgi:hypothetical protein
MTYDTFVRRAEKRMLGLRDKLQDAPFLKEHGIDGQEYLKPSFVQQELELGARNREQNAPAE